MHFKLNNALYHAKRQWFSKVEKNVENHIEKAGSQALKAVVKV